jgi:hypothetical protein
MQFDPAIAAQASFKRAMESDELGPDQKDANEAEEVFSASAGSEARAAYFRLLEIGRRHPSAASFEEFLIYITWQQVTEETIPEHFRRGAELSDNYLSRPISGQDPIQAAQIRELRQSFLAGLGQTDDDDAEYDEDTLKGGD